LLGGFADRLACTALLGWGEPGAVADEAIEARERLGVYSFKLKVGVDLARDVAITERVREAVGEQALLYADANRAYSVAEARLFVERTRPAGLAWIEEPCEARGRPSRTRFVSDCPIPVLGDETCADVEDAVSALLNGQSTMVSIKPARTGVRGSLRIRDIAEGVGAEVLVGSSGESAAGTFATASVAAAGAWTARHPAELLMYLDMADDIVVDLPVVRDGELQVPTGPGFGLHLDPDRLAALRTAEPVVVEDREQVHTL
jgi:L-alanine-DL-glutamate epimerase-like enolase superfamily enzyme